MVNFFYCLERYYQASFGLLLWSGLMLASLLSMPHDEAAGFVFLFAAVIFGSILVSYGVLEGMRNERRVKRL